MGAWARLPLEWLFFSHRGSHYQNFRSDWQTAENCGLPLNSIIFTFCGGEGQKSQVWGDLALYCRPPGGCEIYATSAAGRDLLRPTIQPRHRPCSSPPTPQLPFRPLRDLLTPSARYSQPHALHNLKEGLHSIPSLSQFITTLALWRQCITLLLLHPALARCDCAWIQCHPLSL